MKKFLTQDTAEKIVNIRILLLHFLFKKKFILTNFFTAI